MLRLASTNTRIGTLALLLAAACGESQPIVERQLHRAHSAGPLRIRGSDTMLQVCQRWTDAYAHVEPGVRVTVSGGGTGAGIAALVNGTADIAAASRRITAKERARILAGRAATGVIEVPAMLDALVFYVHERNAIRSLSLAQLRAAFLGRIERWDPLGGDSRPLVLYGRENSSGTYLFFKERGLGGLDFAPRVLALQGTGAVLDALAHDPHGLGYGGLGFGGHIRRIAIRMPDGTDVAASSESVRSGRYPLTRALMLYAIAPPTETVARFLTWVGSNEAQREITRAGHFPLTGDGVAPEL